MQEWREFLTLQSHEQYFQDLALRVTNERKRTLVYPDPENTFKIFASVPLAKIKVVIIGQDPYHNGAATGVAFESTEETVPASLNNIFKEIQSDIGDIQIQGRLSNWIDQGVFLLNRVLTVENGRPGSHYGLGWEIFTERVIKHISDSLPNVVFMLWGQKSAKCSAFIDKKKHLILKAAHPSPLSAHRGFFNCKHFSACNEFLKKHKIDIIDWNPIKVEGEKNDRNIIAKGRGEQSRIEHSGTEPDFGY
ncbi:uracil-DNA glycosylase [bacterium]|nr:uracil-DNA glycosylase [Candidatus Elulimicrobium humile]